MLTQERLKELLRYEPETGLFYRKTAIARNVKIGDIAGSQRKDGYVQIGIDYVDYQAHRLAWLYVYGEWSSGVIDHINGVRSDNRISNLRDVGNNLNAQNQIVAHKNNKLGILGVSKIGNKFRAAIMINGRHRHLGYYTTVELAHAAYLEAKRKHHEGNTL